MLAECTDYIAMHAEDEIADTRVESGVGFLSEAGIPLLVLSEDSAVCHVQNSDAAEQGVAVMKESIQMVMEAVEMWSKPGVESQS